MKKLIVFVLTILFVVGTAASSVFASTATIFLTHQPKCPKELLK